MTKPCRFVVLGVGGSYTLSVIKALIDRSYNPLVYFQPGTKTQQQYSNFANIELEINKPRNELTELLEKFFIPVYFQTQGDIAKRIQQLQVEFLLVACWPELLSGRTIHSVTKAALNVHPSLLPRYRGPDPIQTQLDINDFNFGVTLHLLNNQFDAGDIVLQQSVNPENRDRASIEKIAAEIGAELFIQAMNTYENPGWELNKQT